MTLRRKLIIIIAISTVLVVGILYTASATVISNGFERLERQEMQKQTTVALDALSNENTQMKATLLDWAYWDDAYQFVADQNPDFIHNNLTAETLRNLKLNLIVYTNEKGKIIYQGGYDLVNNKETSLPEDLLALITPDNALLTKPTEQAPLSGFLKLKEGPMLVGSSVVLTSQEQGPSHGIMIIGRLLNDSEQKYIGDLLHLPLTLMPINQFLPDDFMTARAALKDEQSIFIRPVNTKTVAGYAQLKDIYGQPALILKVEAPRNIYSQGNASQRLFLYFVLIICLAVALAAYLVFYSFVIHPIENISKAVNDIGVKADPSARLSIEGNDEFASLSQSINEMLAELEQRLQLQRRVAQIRTASEISRTISAVLDQKELLQQVVNLIAERLDLYYVGVFLIDEKNENAALQAGTGEAGQKMLAANHKLAIGSTSMIGRAIAARKSLIALDVGKEAVRFNNPLLQQTRSELAIPIISGEDTLGAMTVQSSQARAFDENDIVVLQGIADSLATALKNAALFQQVQTNLEEIRSLHRQYLTKSWAEVSQQPGQFSFTFENERAQADSASQTFLDVPISLRHQMIGHLRLDLNRPSLSPSEISLVEAVVNETALALENTRLVEEVQRRAQEQRLISDISAKTSSYLDLEMVMKTAVQEIGRMIHATKVQIRLENVSQPSVSSGNGGSTNLN